MLTKTVKSFGLAMGLLACSLPLYAKNNVVVVATGGTIAGAGASSANSATYTAAKVPVDALINAVPQIQDLANVSGIQALQVASESITDKELLQIARQVNELVKKPTVNGVVITHGTDTLEETAFFLDLYFNQIETPIIFTGSMRNYSDIAYDGLNNIVSSILVATHPNSKNKGVLVVLNDTIHHPYEVTKSHTVSLDTFQSLEFGPIGVVDDLEIVYYRSFQKQFQLGQPTSLHHNVAIYKTYTGDTGHLLRHFKDFDGVIIEGFGRGNVPPAIVEHIEYLIENNVSVMISSRVPKGRPFPTYPYVGGAKQLTEIGCVLSPHLNSQKARLLLMIAIATHTPIKNLTI